MRFRHHKYTWTHRFTSVQHWWEFVGPNGAVHFSAHVNDNAKYGTSAGLEFHHLSGEGAPNHVNCPLTGGRCWHDGTSSYAMDYLWPVIEPMLREGRHDAIFHMLEAEYDRHFETGEPS